MVIVTAAGFALAGNLVGLLVIFGYAYDVVALHTMLGLVVANLGALLVRPRSCLMAIVTSSTIGGVMMRRWCCLP